MYTFLPIRTPGIVSNGGMGTGNRQAEGRIERALSRRPMLEALADTSFISYRTSNI